MKRLKSDMTDMLIMGKVLEYSSFTKINLEIQILFHACEEIIIK